MSLELETQVYKRHLPDLLGTNDENEGKYTVIKDQSVAGPFADYDAALDYGYEEHGLTSFLVKKIERNETVMFFSRDLR